MQNGAEPTCANVMGSSANACCRRQKLCCGRPQKGLLRLHEPQSADGLLDLTRAAYLIAAQRQPGKFTLTRDWRGVVLTSDRCRASQYEEAAEASKNYGNRINAPRARQRLVKGETLMRGMREALRCAGGRPRQWHYDCALSGAGAAVTQDRSA